MSKRSRKQKRPAAADAIDPPISASTRRRWPIVAALAAATLVAYLPALSAPFGFDDVPSIQTNWSIRQAWPPWSALHPPSGDLAVSGRPVVNYSLALNYAANRALDVDQRPDPFGPRKTIGYHVVNIALHLLCGALVLGLVRRTLSLERFSAEWRSAADRVAMVAAALWMIHPIQTEAVNYVVQRTELLVSACYIGTVYCMVRAWSAASRRRELSWRIAAVVVCALGMGSKEVMITAPIMVVLYTRAFRVSSWRSLLRRDRDSATYLALALTSVWAISLTLQGARSATVGFHLGVPWYRYFYSQCWAILHYLRLLLWPDSLMIDYGQAVTGGWHGIPGLVLLSAAGVGTIAAWRHTNRWGWLAFLGTWFFFLLGPSSSFVPIASEAAAERRIYLALAAVTIIVAVALESLRRRLAAQSTNLRATRVARALPWTAAGIGLALGVATFRRSAEYAHPETLWRDAIARLPENPRAYVGLSYVLLHEQTPPIDEAAPLLQRAVQLDSDYVTALFSLAGIAIKQARFADAKPLLERVLKLEPHKTFASSDLAGVLVALGDPVAADKVLTPVDLDRMADEDPTGESLTALGTTYMALGRVGDAVPAFTRAIDLNPSSERATEFLADALIRQGKPVEAIDRLEREIRGGSRSAFGLALLSLAYADAGRDSAAIAAADAAVSQGTSDEAVFVLTGQAMLKAKQPVRARQLLDEAARLRIRAP